jgi:hypothetical protein
MYRMPIDMHYPQTAFCSDLPPNSANHCRFFAHKVDWVESWHLFIGLIWV